MKYNNGFLLDHDGVQKATYIFHMYLQTSPDMRNSKWYYNSKWYEHYKNESGAKPLPEQLMNWHQ